METMKKPETVISLATAAGLVGSSVYFYKKIQTIEEDLEKFSETLSTVTGKVNEHQSQANQISQVGNYLREMAEKLEAINREVVNLKKKTEASERRLEVVISTLEDQEVEFDFKIKKSKKSKRDKKKKVESSSDEEDSESESEDEEDYVKQLKQLEKGKKKR